MSTLKVNGIRSSSASSDAITLASDGTCSANITNNLSNRNIIINGAAQVNQRGTLTGQTSSVYFVDRFRAAMSGAGTWSLSQSTDSPDGFSSSMKLDCTTANTSLAESSFMMIQQKIEGQNVQAFAKGTSAAKQFAVSFYIKSNVSGTYTAEIQDNDNNRIASKTFTVSDGNWNRYSLIFPADTTGAFDNDNAQSMDIKIWLLAGTNYTSGTLNTSSWATKVNANRVSSSNVNLASSTSNELYITGVQLEVGSVVTDFEHRSFAEQERLCQRYFFRQNAEHQYTRYACHGQCPSANGAQMVYPLPVRMRANPTLGYSALSDFYIYASNLQAKTPTSLAMDAQSTISPMFNAARSSTFSAGTMAHLTTANTQQGYLEFIAEL